MSPDLWYKSRATDQQWGKCPIATLRLRRFQRSTGVSKSYSILTELKWHHPPTTELSPTLWLALCSKELCLAGRRQYRHGRLEKTSAVNLESCRVARSLEKLICFKGSFWGLSLVSPLKDSFGDFAVSFIPLLLLRMIPIRSKAHVKTVPPSQPRNTWYHLASLWHCWHSPWHCSRGWRWHSSSAGHRRVAGLRVHFHPPWVLGILMFAPPLLFLVHHMLQPLYPPPTWILGSTPIKAFHNT